MASLNLYPQFETNLMSNRKVIELVLQLKSAKAHGKNYIKVKPHLVRYLLRNRLFKYAPRCLFDCSAYYNIFGKSEVLIRVPALNRSLTVLSIHHHSFSGSFVSKVPFTFQSK